MRTPTQRRDHRNNACIGAKSCNCSACLAASDPECARRRHIPKWSRSIGCGHEAKLRKSARLSLFNDDRGGLERATCLTCGCLSDARRCCCASSSEFALRGSPTDG